MVKNDDEQYRRRVVNPAAPYDKIIKNDDDLRVNDDEQMQIYRNGQWLEETHQNANAIQDLITAQRNQSEQFMEQLVNQSQQPEETNSIVELIPQLRKLIQQPRFTVPPNSQKSHVYSGFTRLTAFTAYSNKHEASITFFVNENQLQFPPILEENNVMHAYFDLPLNSSDKIKVTIKNPNIQPLSISLALFGFGTDSFIPLDDKPLPLKPEPEKNWRIEGLFE